MCDALPMRVRRNISTKATINDAESASSLKAVFDSHGRHVAEKQSAEPAAAKRAHSWHPGAAQQHPRRCERINSRSGRNTATP